MTEQSHNSAGHSTGAVVGAVLVGATAVIAVVVAVLVTRDGQDPDPEEVSEAGQPDDAVPDATDESGGTQSEDSAVETVVYYGESENYSDHSNGHEVGGWCDGVAPIRVELGEDGSVRVSYIRTTTSEIVGGPPDQPTRRRCTPSARVEEHTARFEGTRLVHEETEPPFEVVVSGSSVSGEVNIGDDTHHWYVVFSLDDVCEIDCDRPLTEFAEVE